MSPAINLSLLQSLAFSNDSFTVHRACRLAFSNTFPMDSYIFSERPQIKTGNDVNYTLISIETNFYMLEIGSGTSTGAI